MPIRLNGSTSGYSELSAPAVAGNNTITLPTGNGTAGQHLQGDGTGALSWGVGVASDSQLCKAWVNFNGTGTVAIRASYNVSSITDNGVGDYTVNFTTALADANYSFASLVGSTLAGSDQFGSRIKAAPTTTSLNVASTYGNSLYDIQYFGVAIFR